MADGTTPGCRDRSRIGKRSRAESRRAKVLGAPVPENGLDVQIVDAAVSGQEIRVAVPDAIITTLAGDRCRIELDSLERRPSEQQPHHVEAQNVDLAVRRPRE